MATNFPTSLDNLTNPAGSDPVNNPSHATQHANINDAIENLETKVGVNNSADTTSLDYRVRSLETTPTYTNEMAQDAVAAALAAGTHTNITINYNDTGNSISISAAAGYTNEEAVDAVAAALTAGSGISISYNDAANTITISVDSTIATKTYVDTAVSNLGSTASSTYVPVSDVGNADGVASLDATGQVPFSQLGNLVASAPATLDTLNELATALGNDANFATTTATSIGNKVSKAGGDIITSSLASTIPLVLKGAASQTANLQEWHNSAGTLMARVAFDGSFTAGGYNGATKFIVDQFGTLSLGTNRNISGTPTYLFVQSQGATDIGAVIKGAASQTANLQQWQNSAGTVLAKVDSAGAGTFVGFVSTTSGQITNDFYIGNQAYVYGAADYGSALNIITRSTSQTGIILRGRASQSADLQQWQNSAGTVLSYVRQDGAIALNTMLPTSSNTGSYLTTGSGAININSRSTSTSTFNIIGNESQTADLQQWQISTGSLVAKVTPYALQVGPNPAYPARLLLGNGDTTALLSIITHATNQIGAVIRGQASQTANLQEWQNSAGAVLAYVNANGDGIFSNVVTTNDIKAYYGKISSNAQALGVSLGQISAITSSASTIGLVIRGTTSQTANLQEWQNSAGTVLAAVEPTGSFYGSSITAYGILTTNSSFRVNNASAGTTAAIIKGAASQTADLQQWQDSAGTVYATISPYGQLSIGLSPTIYGNSRISINTVAATAVGQVIRGVVSQTANLQEWQNSAGTVLSKVDASGAMFTITPADSTNTTQVATTAYVKSNINNLINSAPGTLDTLGEIATALAASDSAAAALVTSVNLKAPLASPALTGTPTAPTAVAGTNTTQLATTAFVKTELSTSIQPGALYQTSAPSSPAVGQIWIDSDEDVTTFDPNIIRRKAITATAGQTVFTADLPFIDGFEQIFMNGLLLVKTTDYTTSGGNTVTLTSAAAASDVIEIVSVTGANSVNTYTQAEVNALLAANTSVAPLSISANTTLVAKKRYFVTSASALTLTLPASPALNDEIQIVDASGNASTYNITVARNANKINGGLNNLIIDTNGGWYTLLYTGATYGWKVG